MTVARILDHKGHSVVSAQPHRTIREVADTLAEHRIGAVIVAGADGAVIGILSERDIVRAISTDGAGALDQPVTRYMTRKVVSCRADHRIVEVMEMMTAGKFRHVPVIESERLRGMISIGDVVKHRLEELESESRSLRDYIAMA